MKKMRTSPWIPALAMVLHLLPQPLASQSVPVVTWQGEIRPRAEQRKPVEGGWESFVSMRTRIAAHVRMEGGLGLFFQLQDVRTWGEEAGVRDRSADNMDFHQAYLEVGELPAVGGLMRAGRQEVDIAESRLMGAPNWGQGGQTFDGARWIRPAGDHRFELVALRIAESSTPAHQESSDFLAAWYHLPEAAGGTADLFLVHDRVTGSPETSQSSLGGVWKRSLSPFDFTLQGIYQTGTREGLDVEASLISAQGTLNLANDAASVTLWYDRLSGDDDLEDDVTKAFTTLYGARNRYYGRADYFLDIPGNTRGLGLLDAALKLSWTPRRELRVNLDLHAFRTSRQGNLGSQRLGEELDGWVRLRAREHLTLQAGYSVVWGGPGMEALELLTGNGYFGYFMTSLRF